MEFTLRTEQAINHITCRYKKQRQPESAQGVEWEGGGGVAHGNVNENVLCIEKSMHHAEGGKAKKVKGKRRARENTQGSKIFICIVC